MGSHMIIRPIQMPNDVFEFRRLVERNAEDMNIAEHDVERRVLEFLRAAYGPNEFLVAANGSALHGFVLATRGRSHGRSHTAALRVVVDEYYRGQGLGGRLVDTVVERLEWTGVARIEATPYVEPGTWALKDLRFWRKRGFLLEGVKIEGAKLLDGTVQDVAMLARLKAA